VKEIGIAMPSKPVLAVVTAAALVLGACSSSASPPAPSGTAVAVPASQIAVATLVASAVPQPTAAPVTSPSAEPSANTGTTSIDPCSLLKVDQASATIGKKLNPGVSDQVDNDRVCTFKSGLTELKIILTPPAPDAATAKAYWDDARAAVPADIPLKDLTVFDRSAYGSGSAGGYSLSALFVIDGTNVFDVFCANPACTEARSVGAAELIAGNLP